MSEAAQNEEIERLKATVQELLRDAQGKDIEIQMLSRAKATAQVALSQAKERNTVLEKKARDDENVKRALLVLVGVLRHDISALRNMADDPELPSERFTVEAMRVVEKLSDLFDERKVEATTGVVAKPQEEVGDAKSA